MSEEFSKDFDPDNPFEPDENNIKILENLPDDIEYSKDIFQEFEIEDSVLEQQQHTSVFENDTLDRIVKDYQLSKLNYNALYTKHKDNKKDH